MWRDGLASVVALPQARLLGRHLLCQLIRLLALQETGGEQLDLKARSGVNWKRMANIMVSVSRSIEDNECDLDSTKKYRGTCRH